VARTGVLAWFCADDGALVDPRCVMRTGRESGARNFACYTSSMQSTTRPLLRSATSTDSSLVGPAPATGDSIGAEITALRAAEITGLGGHEYRPGLATSELVAEIRGLLATERRASACSAGTSATWPTASTRGRMRSSVGTPTSSRLARQCFGLRARDMRERVRVGRALRTLRRIERAFIDGELSYSRAREVTRVATVQTEPEWLELARRLDMRSLERRVVAEARGEGPQIRPARRTARGRACAHAMDGSRPGAGDVRAVEGGVDSARASDAGGNAGRRRRTERRRCARGSCTSRPLGPARGCV